MVVDRQNWQWSATPLIPASRFTDIVLLCNSQQPLLLNLSLMDTSVNLILMLTGRRGSESSSSSRWALLVITERLPVGEPLSRPFPARGIPSGPYKD
eukprot:685562-Rhodomonas_salina.1